MAINRLNRAKTYRIFHDFSWPAGLHDFARFNLIYGWNGSGKTTLSEVFKCIERKQAITEGIIEILVDGATASGANFAIAANLPRVRVFNRAYVDANLHITSSPVSLSPIFFLGEKNVEKQKQIEALKIKHAEATLKSTTKNASVQTTTASLDDFCIERAKAVKDLLSSSPSNSYNSYNKANFRQMCDSLSKPTAPSKLLTPEKTAELKRKKEERPKEVIEVLSTELPDLKKLTEDVNSLLARTVVSRVLDELTKDSELSEWVQTGLRLHTGEKDSKVCRFCGSTIPSNRIQSLEHHFNDAYNAFLTEIDDAKTLVSEWRTKLKEIDPPNKAQFYDSLAINYTSHKDSLQLFVRKADKYLAKLTTILDEKRTKPFESLLFDSSSCPAVQDGTDVITTINGLIESHNKDTANFQKLITDARKNLEDTLVAEALTDFKAKTAAITLAKDEAKTATDAVLAFITEIGELEKEIVEHRKPADQLNVELRSYLGRDELKFELKETGYEVMRHGAPALNLSEGERTAIAFLYFLKTLQDKGFSLKDDIVVVDDPVSSLDANALFCAFGYMKERTKDAGQLFVLTHNFGLFRQVKNWFNYINGRHQKDVTKHKARFFMMDADVVAGIRGAKITALDSLLHEFESEYHYLFKKVNDCAAEGVATGGLDRYYAMPNIARRLLESFLCFRFPALAGELFRQLEQVDYDPAKKARILRFLHTYSHDGKIADPEHDLSILSETPQIAKDILELIKAEDSKHSAAMTGLVTVPTP